MEKVPHLAHEVIAVAGDWHGNEDYALKIIALMEEAGVTALVHTGDFGFTHKESYYMQVLEAALAPADMLLIWVDGNHEHHTNLLMEPLDPEDGFRKLTPHIWHAPRGHRWDFQEGITWMALGGAASVDRITREEGFDWFPEEYLTREDVEKAKRPGEVFVMVAHDAPRQTPHLQNRLAGRGSIWPPEDITLSERNQDFVQEVVEAKAPLVLFHGHHHHRYSDWVGKTQVVGLDCNGTPPTANVILVDPFGERLG